MISPSSVVSAALSDYDLDAAAVLAKGMDKCLVFVTSFSSEGADRTNLTLYNKCVLFNVG